MSKDLQELTDILRGWQESAAESASRAALGTERGEFVGKAAVLGSTIALLSAQAREIERLKAVEEEAIFLTERLTDFDNYSENKTEDGERDWHGHVAPSLSRLKTAIKARAALQTQAGGE